MNIRGFRRRHLFTWNLLLLVGLCVVGCARDVGFPTTPQPDTTVTTEDTGVVESDTFTPDVFEDPCAPALLDSDRDGQPDVCDPCPDDPNVIDGDGGNCATPPPTCVEETLVEHTAQLEGWFTALTNGISEQPIDATLPEDSNGTLTISLNPNVMPLISSDLGTFAATSMLEKGRIVAFSGQDFIGSDERSTLLGVPAIDQLVANSVSWAANSDVSPDLRVLVANPRIQAVLNQHGFNNVQVAPILLQEGLWQTRDWTAAQLTEYDVAVVQVNEWGTLMVGPTEIEAIRNFVALGGGLVIAGSKQHWTWWLSDSAERFIGDLILSGSGIHWRNISVRNLTHTTATFEPLTSPKMLWCAYLDGEPLKTNQMVRLPGLFASAKQENKISELNAALTRLHKETPALPAPASSPQAHLSAEVGASLPPHDWFTVHPWTQQHPGIPSAFEPMDQTVRINTAWNATQPLGLYAYPGSVVHVTVPSAHVGTGLRVRVGDHYDDLRSVDTITQWQRAPRLLRRFRVTTETTTVGFAFGGPLYLVVPDDYPETEIDITVSGAIQMAVYTRGESSPAQWQPSASAAPQTILQERGRIRMVVPTSEAAMVTDPETVIAFWSGFHASHTMLAQEPSERRAASHWLFDPQIGWGFANTTTERIAFPDEVLRSALRTETGDEDWWLFGHELGHHFQTQDWTNGDLTEVAVNLFTMYTLNSYIYDGGDFETIGFQDNTIDHESLKGQQWASADPFGKLEMYRQLIFTFGWSAFKQTFASYYGPRYPREQFGSAIDGFAIRLSAIVQRDLSPFFVEWEYPLSNQAITTIQSFEYETWLPPGWEP